MRVNSDEIQREAGESISSLSKLYKNKKRVRTENKSGEEKVAVRERDGRWELWAIRKRRRYNTTESTGDKKSRAITKTKSGRWRKRKGKHSASAVAHLYFLSLSANVGRERGKKWESVHVSPGEMRRTPVEASVAVKGSHL